MNAPSDKPEVHVDLYSLTTCAHCKTLRRYLDARQVAYRVTYVDRLCGEERNRVLRRLRRLNPAGTFPTIVVGDTVVTGFKKEALTSALAALSQSGGDLDDGR